MAKSKEELRAYDAEWKIKNTKQYNMRISINTGIPDALDRYAQEKGVGQYSFIRQAIEEKLEREGYLKKPE